MRALLKRLVATLVFPQACVLCTRWVSPQNLVPLCRGCRLELKPLQDPLCVHCGDQVSGLLTRHYGLCRRCRVQPPSFDEGWSWGAYDGELRQLIRHFKYGRNERLVAPLAELMLQAFHRHQVSRPDVVIPVPSHPGRIRQRGFDAVGALASQVSRSLDIRTCTDVSRVRNTVPLYGLDREARQHSLAGAFRVRKKSGLEKSEVLLIDDILTTGATANEISRILRGRAGVRSVTVLVIARTVKHFQ